MRAQATRAHKRPTAGQGAWALHASKEAWAQIGAGAGGVQQRKQREHLRGTHGVAGFCSGLIFLDNIFASINGGFHLWKFMEAYFLGWQDKPAF